MGVSNDSGWGVCDTGWATIPRVCLIYLSLCGAWGGGGCVRVSGPVAGRGGIRVGGCKSCAANDRVAYRKARSHCALAKGRRHRSPKKGSRATSSFGTRIMGILRSRKAAALAVWNMRFECEIISFCECLPKRRKSL